MTLRRTVELPAVPRTGEVVYVDPYTEPLTVTGVTWTATPDEGESHVLGEDEDALEMFTDTGWIVEK